jgi:hypothetical protein
MVRPDRFELPTNWFEASYSIQLSYGRSVTGNHRMPDRSATAAVGPEPALNYGELQRGRAKGLNAPAEPVRWRLPSHTANPLGVP